jgi:hypothetical protein
MQVRNAGQHAGSGSVAIVNAAGKVSRVLQAVFHVPGEGPRPIRDPGAALNPARRRTLELELEALRLIADDKMSSETARKKAALDAAKLEKLLALPAQSCKAGQTFTTRRGDTYEHQCTCGRHVEVVENAAQRAREDVLEETCKRIAAARGW